MKNLWVLVLWLTLIPCFSFACLDWERCYEKAPELMWKREIKAYNNEPLHSNENSLSFTWDWIEAHLCNDFTMEYAIYPWTYKIDAWNVKLKTNNLCTWVSKEIEDKILNLSWAIYKYTSSQWNWHKDSFTLTTMDNHTISFERPSEMIETTSNNVLAERCILDWLTVNPDNQECYSQEELIGNKWNRFCKIWDYFNWNCKKVENKDFNQEMIAAYNWSYSKWITTMQTIKQANTDKEITRAELSKMVANYSQNILNNTEKKNKACNFSDIENVDYSLKEWITNACQLWLMWQWITDFRPNDSVTRAEFWTVLSRMLFNTEDWKDKYYSTHLAKLKSEWIITNDNSDLKELRWFVMLMLMRSENNYKWELTIIWPNNWFDDRIKQWELVLRWSVEDHTDYIFFASWNWQNYLYKNSVYPWEKVNFQWKVKSIDWAAWSHYYEAESIYKLEDNNEWDIHLCRWIYDTKDIERESCDENIKSVVCADDWKEYVNSDCACMNPWIYSFTFWKCNN